MKKLENLHGKKIRRLYLSPFIYTFLSFLPMIPIMYLISDLKENKFVFSEFKSIYSFEIPEKSANELSDITENYLSVQTDHRFSTLDFFNSIKE